MKKKLFKKNQIIITALAVMIAVAGYINYADKNLNSKVKNTTAQTDEKTVDNDTVLKDIESLDTDITDVTTDAGTADAAGTEANTDQNAAADTPGEAVLTGAGTYLAQARLDREQTRSQNKETLLSIINNTDLTETERQSAIQSMVEMTDTVEKEEAAELLLEAKGFEGAVVNMTGETVDVVVPQNELGDDQRAQIEDIVKRKTGSQAENIVITPID
ncbi:SpoIIIAH-like family protein [Novisyntrophococcus fermenticellae]|uniref:SpoIIIAH-like family protein n=1 Tax=Novisyntrophococcus fermenticellae TaxID=2068655 RepID=UPI001E51B93F|nr:SpoIIIAH-like family protein [Novisyntrophococcus fermenticellae]